MFPQNAPKEAALAGGPWQVRLNTDKALSQSSMEPLDRPKQIINSSP